MPRVAPGLGMAVRGRKHRGQDEDRSGREEGEAVGHGGELHWVVAGEHHLVERGAPQVRFIQLQ